MATIYDLKPSFCGSDESHREFTERLERRILELHHNHERRTPYENR